MRAPLFLEHVSSRVRAIYRTTDGPDIGLPSCGVPGNSPKGCCNEIAKEASSQGNSPPSYVAAEQRPNTFFLTLNALISPRRKNNRFPRGIVESDARDSNHIFQLDSSQPRFIVRCCRRNATVTNACRRVSDAYDEARELAGTYNFLMRALALASLCVEVIVPFRLGKQCG
jgi:hypothetical protein